MMHDRLKLLGSLCQQQGTAQHVLHAFGLHNPWAQRGYVQPLDNITGMPWQSSGRLQSEHLTLQLWHALRLSQHNGSSTMAQLCFDWAAGSMRMLPSGDVIAIPLAERLREKARAARAAAVAPVKAGQPDTAAIIAPVVADGAVKFAVAGAAHRHKTAGQPSENGAVTPQGRWHSAFSASSGIFSG